ncbi:MAG: DJ-1/PfpI family protein [Acidobacteria bacterium]|nr:DJ-1/PfpI family protein [Acidobacteriota bacterium]
MKNVAILIFDEVEVLDFCGPFEVFSVAGRRSGLDPFHVYTVARESRPVLARNGLSVNPAHTLGDCPRPDVLVVPGGYGTRREMHNEALTDWIAERAKDVELLLSVCTGALLLAKAGLLEGLSATTHHGALGLLKEVAPNTEVLESERVVDNGKVIVSAGISAGIDMSLYAVGRLLGVEHAEETARYMEYDWSEKGRRPAVA